MEFLRHILKSLSDESDTDVNEDDGPDVDEGDGDVSDDSEDTLVNDDEAEYGEDADIVSDNADRRGAANEGTKGRRHQLADARISENSTNNLEKRLSTPPSSCRHLLGNIGCSKTLLFSLYSMIFLSCNITIQYNSAP